MALHDDFVFAQPENSLDVAVAFFVLDPLGTLLLARVAAIRKLERLQSGANLVLVLGPALGRARVLPAVHLLRAGL